MYCEFQIFSVARIKVIKPQPKPQKTQILRLLVQGSKRLNADQGVLRKYISQTAIPTYLELGMHRHLNVCFTYYEYQIRSWSGIETCGIEHRIKQKKKKKKKKNAPIEIGHNSIFYRVKSHNKFW